MAVQKRKKARSRSAMRRSHNTKAQPTAYSADAMTGEMHLRHHITATGYYRGKVAVEVPIKKAKDEQEEE